MKTNLKINDSRSGRSTDAILEQHFAKPNMIAKKTNMITVSIFLRPPVLNCGVKFICIKTK